MHVYCPEEPLAQAGLTDGRTRGRLKNNCVFSALGMKHLKCAGTRQRTHSGRYYLQVNGRIYVPTGAT